MGFYNGVINKYKDYLPVDSSTPIITIHEGNTPLLLLENLTKKLTNYVKIYGKYEGLNPTGSFKDRGISLAISKAKEEKAQAVICASTGNTSASAAAYAAKAGLKCIVVVPAGRIAQGKLAQAMVYGAIIIQVDCNFDVCMELVKQVSVELPLTVVNCINPYRPQGQKTAAFEIIEALGDAPDYHCLPVGNAANYVSNWMGYKEYKNVDFSTALPKMIGYQAEGAAPLVDGKVIENPSTLASAISIGNPQYWKQAEKVKEESSGWFDKVSDEKILAAQYDLANLEGIFVEPASAAAVAGMIEDINNEKILPGSRVVCTLTGSGLKDPDVAIKYHCNELNTIAPDFDIIKEMIVDSLS